VMVDMPSLCHNSLLYESLLHLTEPEKPGAEARKPLISQTSRLGFHGALP
jgi:hypothetical protein